LAEENALQRFDGLSIFAYQLILLVMFDFQ